MTWPSTQPPAISTVVQSMVLWFVAKSIQFVLQCHHEYLGTCRGAWSWLRASPYYSLLLCEWWGYGQWKLAIYVNIYVCVSVYAWVIKGCVCVCQCVCVSVALRKEHECFTILYELSSFYFFMGELLWFLLLSYAKAMWERNGFWVDSIISFLLKKQTHWLYDHNSAEREASYIQFKNTLKARYYVRTTKKLLSSFCFCREKREKGRLWLNL